MTQSVKKPETKKPLKKSLIQKSVPKKLIKSKASKSSEKPLNEKPVMKRKTTDRVERVKKTLSFLKTHGTIPKELENLSKSSKQ